MGLDYEKGVPINSPSIVFKAIANNLQLIEGQSPLTYDFNKLKVKSKLVNAIQYFLIDGLTLYSFGYISKDKLYLFKTKEEMTEAIRILIEDRSVANSSISYLMLEIIYC